MSKPTWNSTSDGEPLTDRQTAGLLEMCVSLSRRPVDRLIDRLHEPDGPEWWQGAVETICASVGGATPVELLEGRATVELLSAFIKSCSQQAKSTTNLETQLHTTAGYFAAVATGLVFYKTLIATRRRSEWEPLIRELAEVLPSRWNEMFQTSAAILEQCEPPNGSLS